MPASPLSPLATASTETAPSSFSSPFFSAAGFNVLTSNTGCGLLGLSGNDDNNAVAIS